MGLFQEVEGEAAVLVEGGVYRQVPVYKRNGFLFAKSGAGFVRLYADRSTSKPKCRLETLTWGEAGRLGRDSLGRLCVAGEVPDASIKVTLLGNDIKLLGAPY